MIQTHISLVTTVMICFHNLQNMSISITITVERLCKISTLETFYIADMSTCDTIAVCTDDIRYIVIQICTQRTGAQAQTSQTASDIVFPSDIISSKDRIRFLNINGEFSLCALKKSDFLTSLPYIRAFYRQIEQLFQFSKKLTSHLSGDEFVVFIYQHSSQLELQTSISYLICQDDSIHLSIEESGASVPASFSMGCAYYPQEEST